MMAAQRLEGAAPAAAKVQPLRATAGGGPHLQRRMTCTLTASLPMALLARLMGLAAAISVVSRGCRCPHLPQPAPAVTSQARRLSLHHAPGVQETGEERPDS